MVLGLALALATVVITSSSLSDGISWSLLMLALVAGVLAVLRLQAAP
jgi:hypothetical protein